MGWITNKLLSNMNTHEACVFNNDGAVQNPAGERSYRYQVISHIEAYDL